MQNVWWHSSGQKPQDLRFFLKVPPSFTPQWCRTVENVVFRTTSSAGWESGGSSAASGVMVWGCNLRRRNSSMLIKGTISQKQVSVLLIPPPSGAQRPSASQVSGKRAQGHVAGRWGQQEISGAAVRLDSRNAPHAVIPPMEVLPSFCRHKLPLYLLRSWFRRCRARRECQIWRQEHRTRLEMFGGRPAASDGAPHAKSFWICVSSCMFKSGAEFAESVRELEAKVGMRLDGLERLSSLNPPQMSLKAGWSWNPLQFISVGFFF